MTPKPILEHELEQQWNSQADLFNQWRNLSLGEQLAWAQARAVAADRAQRSDVGQVEQDVAQPRRRRPPQAKTDQIRDRMPPSLTGFDPEIDDTPISSSGRVRVAKVRKVRRGQLL